MDYIIRESMQNDYIDLIKLVHEIHNIHVENRPDLFAKNDNILTQERFNELLSSENMKLFVVQEKGCNEIIAYSLINIIDSSNLIKMNPRRIVVIEEICVKSKFKRSGIGKFMFNYIHEFAKNKKVSAVELGVFDFNKDAICFYKKMGMRTKNRRMELLMD